MRSVTVVTLGLLCAALVACSSAPAATPTGATSTPSVTVSSPVSGATLSVGVAVPVLVSATDSIGVARVDLSVDGVAVDSYTTPTPQGQPTVAAQLSWTPVAAGAHALSVIAYRQDGTASSPAVVAVTVSSAGTASPGESASPSPTQTEPAATDTPGPTASPTATPTPTPTPTPTRRPTHAPTPSPVPFVDLQPGFYNITTGNEVGVNYVFVAVTLKNFGNAKAGPFDVEVTCRGTTSAPQQLTGLGAGKQVNLVFSFSADAAAGPDGASKWVVDAQNQVTESREDNNEQDISDDPDPDTGAPAPCTPTT